MFLGNFTHDDIIGGCLSALARNDCILVHLAASGAWMECKVREMAVHDLIGVTCSTAGFHLSDFCINLSSLHSSCKIK